MFLLDMYNTFLALSGNGPNNFPTSNYSFFPAQPYNGSPFIPQFIPQSVDTFMQNNQQAIPFFNPNGTFNTFNQMPYINPYSSSKASFFNPNPDYRAGLDSTRRFSQPNYAFQQSNNFSYNANLQRQNTLNNLNQLANLITRFTGRSNAYRSRVNSRSLTLDKLANMTLKLDHDGRIATYKHTATNIAAGNILELRFSLVHEQ